MTVRGRTTWYAQSVNANADVTPTRSTQAGRFPVLGPQPVVDGGRWPARAYVGEWVPFSVRSFREGHDALGVILELTDHAGATQLFRLRDVNDGLDTWVASARVVTEGRWSFRFRAFGDDFATWVHDAGIKIPLGIDAELMCTIGHELFARVAGEKSRSKAMRSTLTQVAQLLADTTLSPLDRFAGATTSQIAALFDTAPAAHLSTLSESFPLVVERERAGYGAWYEFFPRSVGARFVKSTGTWKSGTFRSALKALPRIADLGFDVVYLPPIHPIGVTNRKGKNNSIKAAPGEPGSPWAIGSTAGGHDTIHPDLGTLADFRAFVRRARALDLEVAIDLALQASPDHPWVAEHPEWFTTLPDGSIAFAENPPKKYQDIYPINFDNDPAGIRAEVVRIVTFWIAQGVTIFRVDNPHTKPTDFWEWLIGTVNAAHPEIVFLAEAFTRPTPMQTLGKVGFQQSYTYFAWRDSATELAEYLTEVSHETAHFLRPNFFVTTPDILTPYLEHGGRGASIVRAVLAATGSPSWGIYSGFEILETAKRPEADEQLDNEKYEYRPRDWDAARARGESIEDIVRLLNQARRDNPALHQLRNVTIHRTDDPAILAFSKYTPADPAHGQSRSGIIVVANTAPHADISSLVHLDLTTFGIDAGTSFSVTDLLSGSEWTWSDTNFVRLDSGGLPAHVLRINYSTTS